MFTILNDRQKLEALEVEEAKLMLERNAAQTDYDNAAPRSAEASRRYRRLSDVIRHLSKVREQMERLKVTVNNVRVHR